MLLSCFVLGFENTDFPAGTIKLSFKLYQSYDGTTWEERGNVLVSSHGDKRRKPNVSVVNTSFAKQKVNPKGFYFVGMYSEGDKGKFLQAVVPSCNILGSDLLDTLQLQVNQETGEVLALEYFGATSSCSTLTTALKPQTAAYAVMPKEPSKPYFAPPKVEEPPEPGFFRKYVSNYVVVVNPDRSFYIHECWRSSTTRRPLINLVVLKVLFGVRKEFLLVYLVVP